MKEHLSDIDIVRYRRQKMPPTKIISLNDHLASCAECYKRFEDTRQLESIYSFVRSLFEPVNVDSNEVVDHFPHLPYEQIEAYVDGDLNNQGRQAVENHIQFCHQCEGEVRDLLDLK
ncbi:MAG: zf-HC2 domain-containing protein, partial [Pyrinomonadaceae bacterium]